MTNTKKHIIFVLQGGGAKGPFEIGVMETVEKTLKLSVADIADALVCTSIGAVNGSLLSSKVLSAADVGKIMLKKLPWIFKKRFLAPPMYSRKKYATLYKEYVEKVIGKELKLGDIDKNTHFILTSTNMCDGLNHFIKSDDDKDKDMSVIDATYTSFEAPLYFGQINDPATKSIWLDGGCGIENLPLWQAYIEAWKRGWFNEGHSTHILSIGCGAKKFWIDYDEGSKGGIILQTLRAINYYNSIISGSLASNQSAAVQVKNMEALSHFQKNFTFQHIDWPGAMPKKLDKMDNTKARFKYYETGKKAGESVDFSKLLSTLA
jgi:hypothetical protein